MERRIVINYESSKWPKLKTVKPSLYEIGLYICNGFLNTESLEKMSTAKEYTCMDRGRQEKVSKCLKHVLNH